MATEARAELPSLTSVRGLVSVWLDTATAAARPVLPSPTSVWNVLEFTEIRLQMQEQSYLVLPV